MDYGHSLIRHISAYCKGKPFLRLRAIPALAVLVAMAFLSQSLFADEHQATLKPFSTDGCSMFADGPLDQPYLWRHCCVAHDLAYWKGGTLEERAAADAAMLACVHPLYNPLVAESMYMAVRWGGHPMWLTTYRWGYGWDYWADNLPRGYQAANAYEQAQIAALMPQALATIAADAQAHPATKRFSFIPDKSDKHPADQSNKLFPNH